MLRKFFVILLIPFFISCSSIAGDDVRNMLAGSGEKVTLLQERLKNFEQSLYWQRPSEALLYAEDSYRTELRSKLFKSKRRSRKEKIVDMEVDNVVFSDDGNSADVSVYVRYFKEPVFTVLERQENHKWRFNRTQGGWLIYDYQRNG